MTQEGQAKAIRRGAVAYVGYRDCYRNTNRSRGYKGRRQDDYVYGWTLADGEIDRAILSGRQDVR